MRIAVFGAGAVGGSIGGLLARAGHSVVFVARGAHLEAIRRHGLRVEGPAGDFVVRSAEATDDPGTAGRVEAVLVCVKAWQVGEAARSLLPMLDPGTAVVPLQNGVEAADEIAGAVGTDRVLPGLCRILSHVAAPGVIRRAGFPPSIEFGERDDRRSARAVRLLEALREAAGLTASIPEDIEAAVWEKFLFLAPLASVGALSGEPVGVIRDRPELHDMLVSAIREIAALARARQVRLRPGAVERALALVDSLPADATSSMQRDLMGGRPSELEYLTGAVVRLSRTAGLEAPTCDRIYRALRPVEERARKEVLR